MEFSRYEMALIREALSHFIDRMDGVHSDANSIGNARELCIRFEKELSTKTKDL